MKKLFKSYLIPISVKGIVFDGGKIWLRRNERQEWELPGGKLDEGEQPEETVIREMKEELGFDVDVKGIAQAHLYKIQKSVDESVGVLVVSYVCNLLKKTGEFELEGEAGQAQFQAFSLDEVEDLNMPEFYKEAIRKTKKLDIN